jgi:mannose-1-phosphate guanylyltransferase
VSDGGLTQAIVLCAGHGTRLQPLTFDHPKPLLPFLNVPLLLHILVRLRAAGVRRVALNAFHHAEQLRDFADREPVPGLDLHVRTERELLGTGGGIRNLRDWLAPGPTLLLAGDILTDVDCAALVARHRAAGAEATMALAPHADVARFGAVETGPDGLITDIAGLVGRPGVARAVNASVHVLEPRFLDRLPPGVSCLVRDGYVPALRSGARCAGHVHAGAWAELGTPEAWAEAQAAALAGALPVDAALLERGGRRGGAQSLVHARALVAPDAMLRDGTVVGAAARIGAGAHLQRCWLLPGAEVPAGSRWTGRIVRAAAPDTTSPGATSPGASTPEAAAERAARVRP